MSKMILKMQSQSKSKFKHYRWL